MNKVKIGKLLTRVKDAILLEDNEEYKRVTIKTKGQGVLLRDRKKGSEIGTKRQFLIREGQFLLSKIDARYGAFGIVGQDIDGAIITGNFWTYEVNSDILNIEWFNLFVSSSKFIKICEEASSGTTNRKYLNEEKFLNYELFLPSKSEQDAFVNKCFKYKNKVDLIANELDKQIENVKMLKEQLLEEALQGFLTDKEKTEIINFQSVQGQIGNESNIPLNWKWKKIKDVADVNPRNKLDDELEVSFIPMALIEDGYSNKHSSEIKKWKEIKSGFTHFRENDVVVAKITPCFENRKSVVMKNLTNGYGAGTTELHVLRSHEIVLPEYLLLIVKSKSFIESGVATYTGTAGQQRVKKDFVSNFSFPLPPIEEQRKIVNKFQNMIEYCEETHEGIIKTKSEVLELYETIKSGIVFLEE
ncbi:restriction endonuclease subunit S [Heyndrickxia oleronia]|uniref:Type I restriction modification DNA specificity domain-containing protein n=1 Tax=Heyndrickxia oleronia TaxID=38875 RepID=A0A8E2I9F9_9BACI|nr:restriction endonuclease subunit S [Heyndrickxia oleronia]MEC1376499.1 restriction endonuclease subunit S [Heyndrickxia oleronia]OOP67348.1 hypothetical protein BWZ43_16240 [Heyndrickxia oleronia]QQZ06212.1 restriction endonuclease subunit S [Heyndrickxia oleronia]